jgi:hypothetical protein
MSQGFTKGTPIDTDPTLSLNSDIVVPSQKAVKAYVASQVGTRVGSVTATAPLVSSGGVTPDISIPAATSLVNGYLTFTDWVTFNSKADLASPAFTGTPTAPTAAEGTSTTQIATTAFVRNEIVNSGVTILGSTVTPVSVVNTSTNTLVYSLLIPANTLSVGDSLTLYANTNSNVTNGNTQQVRYYINTSASLAGAQQVGILTNTVGTSNFYGFTRQLYVSATGASGSVKFYPSTTTSQLGMTGNVNATISSLTVNTTVDQYLILALQMAQTTFTCSLQNIYVELRR